MTTMTAKTTIWRRVFLIGCLPSRLTLARLQTVPHAGADVAAPRDAAQASGG